MFVGPVRIGVSYDVSVVSWIRVNDGANRAFLGLQFGFDATPGPSIFCNRNFTLKAYTVSLQKRVIFRSTVIDKHQLTFNITVC